MQSLIYALATGAGLAAIAACDRATEDATGHVPVDAASRPEVARAPAATIQTEPPPETAVGVDLAGPGSLPANVWPARELSVCWEEVPVNELEPGLLAHAQEVVRAAVTRTWEQAAALKLVGWAPCTAGVDLRVRLTARANHPGPWRIGAELLGVEDGLVVRVAPAYLDSACLDANGAGPRGDACLELQAVHYFGHAFGLAHVTAERDIPGCDERTWGTTADIMIGAWEKDAIMNACLYGWHAVAQTLSPVEREAFSYYYGDDVAGTALRLPRNPAEGSNVQATLLWKTRRIGVCWEAGAETFVAEKLLVQQAITDTWQRHSALVFEGWGACTPQSKGLRIRVADEGPHTKGLGRSLAGKRDGMVLNFTFQQWGHDCAEEGVRQGCITSIAVHEFGHALSFAHEQNRSDTPRVGPGGCKKQAQGSDGTVMFGAWDLDSVMNYCNPKYNNDGKLSPTDIAALQYYYDAPAG